jgi:hypothetical protein
MKVTVHGAIRESTESSVTRKMHFAIFGCVALGFCASAYFHALGISGF